MPLEGRVVTLTRQDDQCMVVALHSFYYSFFCIENSVSDSSTIFD